MIRVLIFLLLLAAGALGISWLANHPGEISLTWQGYNIQTTVAVASGIIAAIVGQAPVMEAAIITRTGDNAYSTVKVFETNVRYLTGAPVPSHFQF